MQCICCAGRIEETNPNAATATVRNVISSTSRVTSVDSTLDHFLHQHLCRLYHELVVFEQAWRKDHWHPFLLERSVLLPTAPSKRPPITCCNMVQTNIATVTLILLWLFSFTMQPCPARCKSAVCEQAHPPYNNQACIAFSHLDNWVTATCWPLQVCAICAET